MSDLVSIITPAYNAANYIADMIESVLAQTYTEWELLITDDCSTDNTVDMMIHSVDSLRLARQIEAEAAKKEVDVDILLEVNVAREESKYGFMLEEVEDAVMAIKDFPHVHIKGLMTIAPFVANPEENREVFQKLKKLSVDIAAKNINNVNMSVLSMGMTNDYQVAVEEGATMVRVGTGIFGERDYSIKED